MRKSAFILRFICDHLIKRFISAIYNESDKQRLHDLKKNHNIIFQKPIET